MILQAKIFTVATTTIAGQTVTHAQLSSAVKNFNDSMGGCLVPFARPSLAATELDCVVAEARLRMDGNSVIAKLQILETPYGKIVSQLHESGIKVTVMPVTTVTQATGKLELCIRRLVIPEKPHTPIIDSPLRQVQDWVNGENNWPMFELNDKY